jgi:hypothetical protein
LLSQLHQGETTREIPVVISAIKDEALDITKLDFFQQPFRRLTLGDLLDNTPNQASGHLLFVDKSESRKHVTANILTERWKTNMAESIESALQNIAENRPDLVLISNSLSIVEVADFLARQAELPVATSPVWLIADETTNQDILNRTVDPVIP